MPDGPDPWAGCFPGPSNTGPSGTLTNYTGSCDLTTPVTISNKTFNCDLYITTAGVTITNSQINGKVENDDDPAHTFTLEDVTVDSVQPNGYAEINGGVGYAGFTLNRVEVLNSNRGAWCENVCNITDSYFHGQTLEPVVSNLAHASGVRAERFSNLQHNTVSCDYAGPFVNTDIGCSADVTGYPQFNVVYHNTLSRNLLVAQNGMSDYCAFGGFSGGPFQNDPSNATYQVWTDNVFQGGVNHKCGDSGPITDYATGRTGNVFTGNVWDFDGSPVISG